METTNTNDMRVLTFSDVKLPVFISKNTGSYVRMGEDNLYPDYLQWLYDNGTKHGAVIDGKVTYIAGEGWQTKGGVQDPAAAAFIARANRYEESLTAVLNKVATDIEIFYGAYIQVIWDNVGRQIAEVYHIDYVRMRSNADNTQFYYKEDWSNGREVAKVYPAFNPANPRGSQIYFAKVYKPGQKTYPKPAYLRAENFINAEIEVGKHTNSNAQNGFTPSKSITMVNGEPSDDEKKKITKRFEKAFTGAEGRKFILWFTNGADRRPIIDDLGVSDLSKEDFTAVDNLIQSNIFAGHQITTPALFGISTPGQLGQSTELKDGYEIFQKTYVTNRQQFIEGIFNRIARYKGVLTPLQIIPTQPLGIATTAGPAGTPEATNEVLRSLTGKQHQQLLRIIRQVGQGKLTNAQATVMLKGSLGLSDDEIAMMLSGDEPEQPAQFNAQDDELVLSLFAACGEDKTRFITLKSKPVVFGFEAQEAEEIHFKVNQVSTLEASILDLINKDRLITPEVISNVLKVDIKEVGEALKALIDSDSIRIKEIGGKVVRELTAPLKELQDGVKAKTREFTVKYSYEGPQDSRNRPFCARLMALGRYYTRKEIESISQRLGYSVWDRRGGFYHNPNTDETQPYCRHRWFSHVVMKS